MKKILHFLMLLMVGLITSSLSSCKNDDGPSNFESYYYIIQPSDDTPYDNGLCEFNVAPEGQSIQIPIVTRADINDKYLLLPNPEYDLYISMSVDWVEGDIQDGVINLKVAPQEAKDVSDRTASVSITLLNEGIAAGSLVIGITQSANKSALKIRQLTVYSNDNRDWVVGSTAGWHYGSAGTQLPTVQFDNFDPQDLTVSIDNPDMIDHFEAKTYEEIAGYSNGRPYHATWVHFFLKHNDSGAFRSAKVTIAHPTGDSFEFEIRQEYSTLSGSFNRYTFDGVDYSGWDVNYKAHFPAFYAYVSIYNKDDSIVLERAQDAYWVTLNDNESGFYEERADQYGFVHYIYCFAFNVSENSNWNYRQAHLYFKNSRTGEKLGPVVITQSSQYGDSGGGSGSGGSGGGGGGTGGGSSTDDTAGYTVSSTSVCAIYATDNSSSGDKYSKSWYKWVSSTGKVVLSSSRSSKSGWKGVASKNYDSSCKGFSVSSYDYKYVDYSPVGGTWYYYFN